MQNILDKIIAHKRIEVAQSKERISIDELQKSPLFERETYSLKERLLAQNSSGIIAEFKRQSPSKGVINGSAKPDNVAKGYAEAGVAGMSVLTDTHFFGGTFQDFKNVRETFHLPMLRKDFIVDEYQIYEAKSIGADVLLLIAANLEVGQCKLLANKAKELNIEVLLELHTEEELDYVCDAIDIVGINNRNLKTFKVDLQNSINLAAQIPDEYVKIAESGISDVANIHLLKQHGFQGFLIGENFMKTNNPGAACKSFIEQLK